MYCYSSREFIFFFLSPSFVSRLRICPTIRFTLVYEIFPMPTNVRADAFRTTTVGLHQNNKSFYVFTMYCYSSREFTSFFLSPFFISWGFICTISIILIVEIIPIQTAIGFNSVITTIMGFHQDRKFLCISAVLSNSLRKCIPLFLGPLLVIRCRFRKRFPFFFEIFPIHTCLITFLNVLLTLIYKIIPITTAVFFDCALSTVI